MIETLSKYDILSKKMTKFSKITLSFVSSYALAFTTKKKQDVIKNFIQICLYDAHILFEIRKDVIDYLKQNSDDKTASTFLYSLNQTCNEVEKILVLYLISKKKNDDFIYKIIDFISKKKPEEEIIAYVRANLDKNDIKVLNFMNSSEYNFYKLPEEYQDLVLKDHRMFMDKNINPQIKKEEKKQIQVLKGIKIYKENVDVNFTIKLPGKQKKL